MKRTPTAVLAVITMMYIVAFAVPALATAYEPCGSTYTADLIADGGDTALVVGAVTVSNDETQVCVDIKIDVAGWWITETNIEVAETLAGIPLNKKGTSAVPGDFEDVQYFDISDEAIHVSYCVDLVNIDGDVSNGDTLVVAAHVKVTHQVCKKDYNARILMNTDACAVGFPYSQFSACEAYLMCTSVQDCALHLCPCFTKSELHEASLGMTLAGSCRKGRDRGSCNVHFTPVGSSRSMSKIYSVAYNTTPRSEWDNHCMITDNRVRQSYRKLGLSVEVAKKCFEILGEIID